MIDAEESLRVACAISEALAALLSKAVNSDNPRSEEWDDIREEITRLYRMLGPHLMDFDKRWTKNA